MIIGNIRIVGIQSTENLKWADKSRHFKYFNLKPQDFKLTVQVLLEEITLASDDVVLAFILHTSSHCQ